MWLERSEGASRSNEESSSDIENQEEEEVASENGVENEGTQESENDIENDSDETESSSLETSTTFHPENPCELCDNSKVYGNWSWNVVTAFSTITTRFDRYDCGEITHKKVKTLETNFYLPSKEENEEED